MNELLPFRDEGRDSFGERMFPMWTYGDKILIRELRPTTPSNPYIDVDYVIARREALVELANYDIPVVRTDWVVGEPNSVYGVSEFLGGTSCSASIYKSAPETDRLKAGNTLNTLYEYLKDKIQKGDEFVDDIFSLNQFINVPAKNRLVLVDVGCDIVPNRKQNASRYSNENWCTYFLVREAYLLYSDDYKKLQEWQARAQNLFVLAADANGVVLNDEQIKKLVNTPSLIDWDESMDEFEDCVRSVLVDESNKSYRNSIAELRKKLWRTGGVRNP